MPRKESRSERETRDGFESEVPQGCKKNKGAEGRLRKKVKAFGLGKIFSSLK